MSDENATAQPKHDPDDVEMCILGWLLDADYQRPWSIEEIQREYLKPRRCQGRPRQPPRRRPDPPPRRLRLRHPRSRPRRGNQVLDENQQVPRRSDQGAVLRSISPC